MDINELKDPKMFMKVMSESSIISKKNIDEENAEISVRKHGKDNGMIICRFNAPDIVMNAISGDVCKYYSSLIKSYVTCENAVISGIMGNYCPFNAFICIYFKDMDSMKDDIDIMSSDMLLSLRFCIVSYIEKCKAFKSHRKLIDVISCNVNRIHETFNDRVNERFHSTPESYSA